MQRLTSALRSVGRQLRSPLRLFLVLCAVFVGTSVLVPTASSLWSKNLVVNGSAVLVTGTPTNTSTPTNTPTNTPTPAHTPTNTPTPHSGTVATANCSHGYWKEHGEVWDGVAPNQVTLYQTTQTFASVFGGTDTTSLLDVLGYTGGGLNALKREAVGALLNAAAGRPGFPYSTSQVISMYQAAVAPGGNIEGTKNTLENACDEPDE